MEVCKIQKFYVLIFSLFAFYASAARQGVMGDLTAGVTLPSMNSSVLENPSALADLSERRIEFGVFRSQEFNGGNAGLVAKISQAGVGLDIRRASGQNDQAIVGIGFPVLKSLSFGVGWEKNLVGVGSEVSAGFLTQFSEKLKLGLFFSSLNNFPGSWTLGFGSSLDTSVFFGCDFDFRNASGNFEPQAIQVIPSLVFNSAKKISFKIGFDFPVYPNVDISLAGPSLGLSYWPSNRIGFFVLMNETSPVGAGELVLGLKLL